MHKFSKTLRLELVWAILLPLLICSCSVIRDKNDVTVVRLGWDIPLFNSETGILVAKMKDSCNIYHAGNTVIYEIPYTFEQYKRIEGDRSLIVMGVDYSSRKYKYYVYNLNDSIGFLYDSVQVKEIEKFKVDKFLEQHAFAGANIFDVKNDILVEAQYKKDKHDLVEKYTSISKKPKESYSDTSYYFYSKKMNDINFISLSKTADSLKKMKLYKSVSIFNESNYGKIRLPQRRIVFELQRVVFNDKKNIMQLFKRFNEDRLKMKPSRPNR